MWAIRGLRPCHDSLALIAKEHYGEKRFLPVDVPLVVDMSECPTNVLAVPQNGFPVTTALLKLLSANVRPINRSQQMHNSFIVCVQFQHYVLCECVFRWQ